MYSHSDSDDGNSDYTETSVILGYASKAPTDDPISQLGGQPTWLTPTAAPPSFTLAKCLVCHDPMPLLLQLNGELPQHFPGHARRLYVFACRRKACARKTGAVRALRAVQVDTALTTAEGRKNREAAVAEVRGWREEDERRRRIQERKQLGTTLFGHGGVRSPASANPFSVNGAAAEETKEDGEAAVAEAIATLPDTFAQKVRIGAATIATTAQPAPAVAPPYEVWPTTASALAQPYPSYHIDADYEMLSPPDPTKLSANAQIDHNGGDPDDAAGVTAGQMRSEGDKLIYESLMDKTFQSFADRLAQNPDQVLRYEWCGQPLLYTKTDAVGRLFDSSKGAVDRIPACANCGGERVFEMQLTPQAISELEAEQLGLDGMEWGTIIIGVCDTDCPARDAGDGEVGYVEEWAGVQWEEMAARK